MSSRVVVTVNNIAEVVKQMHEACAAIVAETGQDIADDYTGTAAIRTGFMASSSYVVTHDKSTYGALVSGGEGPMLPEVDKPPDDLTAHAAVAAEYAAFVELGTTHETYSIAAQPAFFPAVDRASKRFSAELSELEKRIKVRGAQ